MSRWYKAFITKNQRYVLLDSVGDIRASASNLEGIFKAKEYYGWGTIHKIKFANKILRIGKEIRK